MAGGRGHVLVVALHQREVAHRAEDDDERQRRERGDALQTPDDGERGGQDAEDEDDALGQVLADVELVGRTGVEFLREQAVLDESVGELRAGEQRGVDGAGRREQRREGDDEVAPEAAELLGGRRQRDFGLLGDHRDADDAGRGDGDADVDEDGRRDGEVDGPRVGVAVVLDGRLRVHEQLPALEGDERHRRRHDGLEAQRPQAQFESAVRGPEPEADDDEPDEDRYLDDDEQYLHPPGLLDADEVQSDEEGDDGERDDGTHREPETCSTWTMSVK